MKQSITKEDICSISTLDYLVSLGWEYYQTYITHGYACKWMKEVCRYSISSNVSTSGKSYYEIWRWSKESKLWERFKSDYGYENHYEAIEAAFKFMKESNVVREHLNKLWDELRDANLNQPLTKW